MRLVGSALLFLRPFAWVLRRQGGGDDQHLAQTALLVRGQDHAADLGVQRQAREFGAGFGELLRVLVDGAKFGKQLIAVGDHARQRRLEKRKVLDIAKMQRLHAQDHTRQRGTQDFRFGMRQALVEIVLVVEADADATGDTAATAGALLGGRLRDRLDQQLIDLVPMRVALDARQPRINDVAYARHGQRGFRHVGRQHDAAALVRLKDAALLLRRLACEQRQHLGAGGMVLAQRLGGFANLALARQKHQHVARAAAMRLVDGIDDGFIDVTIIVHAVGTVAHFNRIQTARDFDHRRPAEMFAESLRVERRRGHDELQLGPLLQHAAQIAEQKVDIQAALVGLVDDQGVVLAQQRIALRLGEQDAVGHQLDVAVARCLVGKADLVANVVADLGLQLLGNARRRGTCGNAARLSMADQAAGAASQLKADLGQLRGLARRRRPDAC